MVNFGSLAAEIDLPVCGTPANFNGFHFLAALLHGSQVVSVSQTAAFNRGRHLCSAGRPSHWALAHILICSFGSFYCKGCYILGWKAGWKLRVGLRGWRSLRIRVSVSGKNDSVTRLGSATPYTTLQILQPLLEKVFSTPPTSVFSQSGLINDHAFPTGWLRKNYLADCISKM